jgi:Holliday junction resolvasome RuvABC endonuclease subunit
MRILGLDISSTCTGVSVINDGYLDFNALDTIEPSDKFSLGQKLLFFEKAVKKLLKKYRPDCVVFEDIFKGPNAKTFKLLAMFRGVAFKAIFEVLKFDPKSIMPTEARKLVGASGVKKEDGFAFVVKKYNLTNYKFEEHNDIADAIVLALARHIQYQHELANPPKQVKKRKKKSKR